MKDFRKRTQWYIPLFIIGLLAAIACTEQILYNDEKKASSHSKTKNEELTIATARKWYEEHYEPIVTTRSSDYNTTERMVRPIWKKAREQNRQRYEVVEIPMQSKGHHIIIDQETANKWKPGNRSDFVRNAAKIVILHDKKTQKTSSFIMIFVGSYQYLQKIGAMGKNSYLHRDLEYDGSVLFYDLNGTFCNGWKYENGKITATISPRSNAIQGEEEDSETLTRAMVLKCHDVCYTYFDEECYEEGFVDEDPEYGMGFGVMAGCYPVSYEECYQECDYVDDGSETDTNWNSGNPTGGKNEKPESQEKTNEQEPCETAQILSNDKKFRDTIDTYYDRNLTEELENGWMKTKEGKYIYPDVRKGTSLNYSASLTADKIFVEQYHCHPANGQSCIPSPADLQKMAFYYQKGKIDVENYTYGVISETGCISIIISSEEKYKIFAAQMYNEEKKWINLYEINGKHAL